MKKVSTCPACQSKNIFKTLDVKDYFLTQENFSIWRCKDCGLSFTNPRPKDENLGKYYESSEYLSHGTKNSGIIGKLYQLLRNINIKRKYNIVSELMGTGKILDIGCGTGELLNYFQKQKWECLGVEPNANARSFAETHYRLKVEEEQSLQNLPEGSFDIVCMWHVLEHVSDINKRMDEAKRLLKNEGRLIIALPNLLSWDAVFYKAYWAGLDVPRHLYHFSPEAFSCLAKRHDLQVINTLPLRFDAFYVSLLSERYRKTRLPIFPAFIKGAKSNWAAAKTGNYSSLIFVLKKNISETKNRLPE
jgi:SAM-dependent methyltransferase